MAFIDSHAHLNFEDFGNQIAEVIQQSTEAGIEKIITIGTSLEDSRQAITIAGQYENIFATVGIHPNDVPTATVENIDWGQFIYLAKSQKVVGIGECGLDYSRTLDMAEATAENQRQKALFTKQIELASELGLPLSIHLRDAQDDLMNEFASYLAPLSGVFHCFSGNPAYTDFIINKLPYFYFSFAGNLTYKNAGSLRELAKIIPEDRLLIETDCPFLSPEPLRGSRNVPANVTITAQKLAEVRGTTLEYIAKQTTKNALNLFKINSHQL